MWYRTMIAAASLAVVASAADRAAVLPKRFSVAAGAHDRVDTPMSIAVGDVGDVHVVEIADGKEIPTPCQVVPSDPKSVCWLLSGTTARETTRTFELRTGKGPASPAAATATKDDAALLIQAGGENVLRYYHAVMPPPKGKSEKYSRSGFIHPLWAPDGQELTSIHAPDHTHHMGLWHPWTKVTFEGRHIDFWNTGGGKGTAAFVEFDDTFEGPVCAGFEAKQQQIDLTAPDGPKAAIDEVLAVTVWPLGAPEKGWLIDYVITQKCASESPVTLDKYRYGGFSIRATLAWGNDNSDYLTDQGKDRKTANFSRAKWCGIWGTSDARTSGVVLMSHKQNCDFPEKLRTWDGGFNKGKSNVFVNFCSIQDKPWVIEPGNETVQRFRLYSHTGKTDAKTAERLWLDFTEPPTIQWLP